MKNWKNEVKSFLKYELFKRKLTTDDLLILLKKLGVTETKASISNKISRGSFSAIFLVQCLYALKLYDLNRKNTPKNKFSVSDIMVPYQLNIFKNNKETDLYLHKKEKITYIDIKNTEIKELKNNKVISLFTGAGGLDIGLEQAGFETVVGIDIDPDSRETIRFNRPNWKLFEDNTKRTSGDVRKIQPDEILDFANIEKEEAALIVGGAPCQPFSNIGKKRGINDPQNGDLFLEFVKMVKGILPKAFIFENVVGITQAKHKGVIEYMKEKLNGLGYNLSYTVLNAANYGVGQRRERFFLLGIRGGDQPAFPLPTHYKGLKEWAAFVNSLDRLPPYIPEPWVTVEEVFNKLPENYKNRSDYAVMNISNVVIERMKLIKPGENFKVLPMDMRPNCWKSGKHQGNDTFGRLRLDEPAVTIRTAAYNPAKGKYIHPTENRGLNTIEMAALQGFPQNWIFKCKNRKKITLKSAGLQIGNAVPPPLAKALGLALKRQIND